MPAVAYLATANYFLGAVMQFGFWIMTDIPMPSAEQEQRAKWDLLLADLEFRQEQLRSTRQDMRLKPWQVAFAGMTAGAALFAAGAAFMKLAIG